MGWTTTILVLSLLGLSACQQRSISQGGRRRIVQQLPAGKAKVTSFNCPQDFGYYPHPNDCSQYYVCVFGGALQESCTGGLVYSHELETCDWPRNVQCTSGGGGGVSTVRITDPRTSASSGPPTATESLTPSVGSFDGRFDHSFSSTKNLRTTQPLESSRSGSQRALFRAKTSSPQQALSAAPRFPPQQFFDAPSQTPSRRPQSKPATFSRPAPSPARQPAAQPALDQFYPDLNYTDADYFYYYDDFYDYYDFASPTAAPARASPTQASIRNRGPSSSKSSRGSSSSGRSTASSALRAAAGSSQPSSSSSSSSSLPSRGSINQAFDFSAPSISSFSFSGVDSPSPPSSSSPSKTSSSRTRTSSSSSSSSPESQRSSSSSSSSGLNSFSSSTSSRRAPTRQPSSSTSSRGSTRSSSSSSGSSNVDTSVPKRTRRPTLKPVSVLAPSAPQISNDIWRFPPRRPAPVGPTPQVDTKATKCDPKVCRLPDCNCGGKDIPAGFTATETPQLVMLTFDDSVNDLNKGLYEELFEHGRVNPNGCDILSTMYVSHEWTDYSQVQNLYAGGHEIASHSIQHSFGEQFSTHKWAKEIAGQREILSAYGGVKMEDVRGMRAPFLAVGGNKMYRMLYEQNFTYDSSMPVYENNPPSWPYTLDYRLFHDCMIPPCPTNSYPGLWQVPMVMWQDLNGGRCSMGDACTTPPDAEGVYKMLIKNFERHYTTNRAPFGLFYHAAWFTTPHHKEGFIAFLDTITAMDDVWLITNWQLIQWMRDPQPLSRVKNFKHFQCDYSDRPRCTSTKVCNVWHKGGVRYMRTCQSCPESYPWTGNTGVRSPLNDA